MSSTERWQSLKQRFIRNDPSAWEDLRRFLSHLAFRQSGSAADSDEVTSDLLEEVIETLVKNHVSGRLAMIRNLRGYCATIAMRRLKRQARARLRPMQVSSEQTPEAPDEAPAPLDQLLEAELHHEVKRVISLLPQSQREVWWLKDREGLSVPEIARRLERAGTPRTIKSVESLLKRARANIRRAIRARLYPDEPELDSFPG